MPGDVRSLRRCLVKWRFFQLSNRVDQESGWDERLWKALQVVSAVDFSLHAPRGADPFGNTAFQHSSPTLEIAEEWNTFSGPAPFVRTGGVQVGARALLRKGTVVLAHMLHIIKRCHVCQRGHAVWLTWRSRTAVGCLSVCGEDTCVLADQDGRGSFRSVAIGSPRERARACAHGGVSIPAPVLKSKRRLRCPGSTA